MGILKVADFEKLPNYGFIKDNIYYWENKELGLIIGTDEQDIASCKRSITCHWEWDGSIPNIIYDMIMDGVLIKGDVN